MDEISKAASILGKKGMAALNAKMTPEERIERARKAGKAKGRKKKKKI